MAYAFLAGVGVAEVFNGSELVFRSKSLTDEGWSLGITAEEIRGGGANALLGQYFHDSNLSVTLTDALFDLQYVALNVGGTVNRDTGNTYLQTEHLTVGANGSIQPVNAPKEWMSLGKVGWYKVEGEEGWRPLQFNDSGVATTELAQGTAVCVRFNGEGNVAQIRIPSDFIPTTATLYMTMPLFAAASAKEEDMRKATKLGEVVVEIPRFQFSGSMDFSITSSGAATSNLSGMALAVLSDSGSCEESGYYGYIKEVRLGGNWYDGLVRMAVDGAEKALSVGDSVTLAVYGQYSDGSVGRIGNDKLTFNSDNDAVDVGAHTGVVSAVSAGTANIAINVTDNENIDAFAKIIVS